MRPEDFIAAIGPAAQANQAKTGIPASFTVAQAALESAWGESGLAKQAFNLFGIKASSGWTGDTVTMLTHEVINGQTVAVNAAFRAYPDWQGSIDDHADFLRRNQRYQPAFDHTGDPESFARSVADAGYATDPGYADKIISIIRSHGLTALDQAGATVAVPEQVTESAQPPPPVQPRHVGGEGELQEAQMPDQQSDPANLVQSAAGLVGVVNPPLGALLQVASALFPKVATLVLDKDKSVPQRNVAIGAAVLDTIAQATGSTNRIDGLAKVANDPVARAAAEQALNPYMVMVDAGVGTVEARKALLATPINNRFEAIRAIGYGFMVAVIALILIIGGGYMLYMVLMDPKTAEQTKGLIIGFICGTAMAAPILFFFGSSGSSKGKDATIQSLSQSR